MRDVDHRLDDRFIQQVDCAFRDLSGKISHALQIVVDLDRCNDEAKISGHGLLGSEQTYGEVVDLDFDVVDANFVLQHFASERFVLLDDRHDAAIDRGLN